MFQIIYIHYFNILQNLYNSLGNPTTSDGSHLPSLNKIHILLQCLQTLVVAIEHSKHHVFTCPTKFNLRISSVERVCRSHRGELQNDYHWRSNTGRSLHYQVEHHVRTTKIYFLQKASPKWVKILSFFFHE